jgi:hypothetical protein
MEPVRGSLEHEKWWRDDTMAVEDGSDSSSTREHRGARESSGEREN